MLTEIFGAKKPLLFCSNRGEDDRVRELQVAFLHSSSPCVREFEDDADAGTVIDGAVIRCVTSHAGF